MYFYFKNQQRSMGGRSGLMRSGKVPFPIDMIQIAPSQAYNQKSLILLPISKWAKTSFFLKQMQILCCYILKVSLIPWKLFNSRSGDGGQRACNKLHRMSHHQVMFLALETAEPAPWPSC